MSVSKALPLRQRLAEWWKNTKTGKTVAQLPAPSPIVASTPTPATPTPPGARARRRRAGKTPVNPSAAAPPSAPLPSMPPNQPTGQPRLIRRPIPIWSIAALIAVALIVWDAKSRPSSEPTSVVSGVPPQATAPSSTASAPKKPETEVAGCEIDPAADPLVVTVTKEWSDLYCFPAGKRADIRAYNPDARFDIEIQGGVIYRFAESKILRLESESDDSPEEVGQEHVDEEISMFEARLRALTDTPEKIRLKLLEKL